MNYINNNFLIRNGASSACGVSNSEVSDSNAKLSKYFPITLSTPANVKIPNIVITIKKIRNTPPPLLRSLLFNSFGWRIPIYK